MIVSDAKNYIFFKCTVIRFLYKCNLYNFYKNFFVFKLKFLSLTSLQFVIITHHNYKIQFG